MRFDAVVRSMSNRRIWVFVLAVGIILGASAGALSKLMKRAYIAETSVLFTKEAGRSSLADIAGQLGGVAALLGTGVAGNSGVNEALAILRSRLLATEFLGQEQRLGEVSALVPHEGAEPPGSPDRVNRAVEYFQQHVLSVSYDARTDLIRLSITWRDRQKAAAWANAYVKLANEVMRKRQIEDAKGRLSYLRAAAERAETLDLQQAIYKLIETQVRTEMLAATRPEFAFTVVDQAVPSQVDDYVRPKSALIGLVVGLLSSLAALGLIQLRGLRTR
jgi:uncharacterized protein involved in exopolysaccharide biosynthesis